MQLIYTYKRRITVSIEPYKCKWNIVGFPAHKHTNRKTLLLFSRARDDIWL